MAEPGHAALEPRRASPSGPRYRSRGVGAAPGRRGPLRDARDDATLDGGPRVAHHQRRHDREDQE